MNDWEVCAKSLFDLAQGTIPKERLHFESGKLIGAFVASAPPEAVSALAEHLRRELDGHGFVSMPRAKREAGIRLAVVLSGALSALRS